MQTHLFFYILDWVLLDAVEDVEELVAGADGVAGREPDHAVEGVGYHEDRVDRIVKVKRLGYVAARRSAVVNAEDHVRRQLRESLAVEP